MRTFEVVLTKSYIVKIQAENESAAKEFSEFYTSDIKNISTIKDEVNNNFKIDNISCKINEAFEANEVYENN